MNFEEQAAKPLLAAAGIPVPPSALALTPEGAAAAAESIGPCAVKAQVPSGKRGKAGGIALAASPAEAEAAAARILGMEIAGHPVERLLVEAQAGIAREFYAAVLNDPESKGPLLLFSAEGGMDIEELAERRPDSILRLPVDIRHGIEAATVARALEGRALGPETTAVADVLAKLYRVYRDNDAELVEINPLALTEDGALIALDCKFALDESAMKRQEALARTGTPEQLSDLEAKAQAIGLRYIALDGSVGILANGAGLTMTSMDAVRHFGGAPANFLEIGGDAYTLGAPALELVLANPKVRSLLINFCGAFARTDVMVGGILDAWDQVKPRVPAFFSVHGTGEEEAVALLRERLGVEPFEVMDDAVKAAVEAAR